VSSATRSAIAVDHDLVALHLVAFGEEIRNAPQAAHEVGNLLTLLAEKEVMMMPGGTLVMRLSPGYLDVPDLPLLDQLLERPVDRGYPQTLHLFTGSLADHRGGQRLGGGIDHLPDSVTLAGFIGHRKKMR